MTIFCNHCGKPISARTKQFRAILPIHTYQWVYYHNECFIFELKSEFFSTPPHRMRGSYQLTEYPI